MNDSPELMIGVAKQDISPDRPELFNMAGMKRTVKTIGVDLPLRVEALALACGGTTVFVLTSDLLFSSHRLAFQVRKQVSEKTGCEPDHLVFGATHCHSGSPSLERGAPPEAEAARDEHEQKLQRAFVQACLEAKGTMVPAEIASASVQLKEPVGQCRRMMMANGTCITAWGPGPFSIPGEKFVGPAAPDSTVIDFLCIRQCNTAQPFAVLTSYASHIHLGALPYFSGETAGTVKRELEAKLPGITALYANGTAGNMDMHCVSRMPGFDKIPGELARQNARFKLLAKRFTDVVLPAVPALRYHRPDKLFHEYYSDRELKDDTVRPRLLVQAVVLGDTALVNLAGEMFNEFGTELHQRNPFANLLIVGYNETGFGYIGTPKAYEQGAYEIRGVVPVSPEQEAEFKKQGFPISRSNGATGKETVDRLIEMLERIKTKMG